MSELSDKVLDLAEAHKGEHEEPPGSNRGPNIDGWIRRRGLDPAKGSYPWCSCFVSAMIEDAANALPVPKKFRCSASVRRLVELNHDLLLDAPEPGCVYVHLDGQHGHTGFVLSVNPDGSINDLSGNSDATGSRTGGSVCNNVRRNGFATHWIRIA